MGLNSELLKQFVKATNDTTKNQNGNTVYGTIVEYGAQNYVKLDGSDLLTPITSVTNAKNGDRVSVDISNHKATVTGNITSPSATNSEMVAANGRIDQQDNTITQHGNTITQINNTITQQGNTITQVGNNITQINNTIKQVNNSISEMNDTIVSQGNNITQIGNTINAINNTIDVQNSTISAQNTKIDTIDTTVKAQDSNISAINTTLDSVNSDISSINSNIKSISSTVDIQNSKIKTVESNISTVNSKIKTVESDISTVNSTVKTQNSKIETVEANIEIYNSSFQIQNGVVTGLKGIDTDWITVKDLEADHATIGTLDSKYANVDFANIGTAAIEKFFSQSGMIKDLVVGDQKIAGELVGVTIRGDLIEGNTIVADKLVIKGTDGLYYKLNTDGITTEAEQTDYNSLNGSVIRAKSITASKIAVNDLFAFNATIAGFHITDTALYSGAKSSATNGTRGIYLGKDGQMAIGDGTHYIKYYKQNDDSFKLAISAENVEFTSGKSLTEEMNTLTQTVEDLKSVDTSVVEYQVGTSGTTAPTGKWDLGVPTVAFGQYLWTRTTITYNDGTSTILYSVSSMGEKGEQGDPGSPGGTGVGIKSVTNYYLATSASSGVTTSTSGWTPTVQSMTDTNKYLWNYEVITYTNNSTSNTTPCVIGRYGDKGDPGSPGANGNGISSITEHYQVSTSNSTAPTTWQDTMPTLTVTNKYLWNYETIKYTNGTSEDSTKRVIGVYGDTGKQGDRGNPGDKGADAITVTITASNGTVFKNNSGSSVLTAHVYLGGVEQSITDAGVCGSLGSIKWYKGSSTTSIATAKAITVLASDVTNSLVYTCQLEV